MPDWDYFLWLACCLLVFAGLSLFGAHRLKILWTYWKHRKDTPVPAGRFAELPVITIQLPFYNEATVIERLLSAVAALDYPRDKLHIQVLDDSTDETAELSQRLSVELRAQGLDVEYRHRSHRVGFKAGALDEAMPTAKGEFIAIFDADFIPPPDMLQQLIHHFTDDRVGVVQARWGHINKDYSLLTRLQALFLDGHLILEQSSRSRNGEFLNFNGTAGIWRKRVIGESGGWQHDTLTEDLDLSYRAQLNGWRFIYLKDVVCPAELPPDMDSFKSQQHRWTKGSVQVWRKMIAQVWESDIPFHLKLEATAHLGANFAYLLTLCTLGLMYPSTFVMETSWAKGLFVDLPVFLVGTLSVILFYLTAQQAQRPGGWWRTLPYIPALLALGIGMSINNGRAVLEALLGQESDFVRTPKYGVNTQAEARKTKAKYTAGKSLALWLECALAVYFGILFVVSLLHGQWMSLPFLGLFFFGFAFVSGSSLLKK